MLENIIKNTLVKEELLNQFLEKLPCNSGEKFIRVCLKSIISDKAASGFSWYGRHGNVAVESYTSMKIISETALKKFPNLRTVDIICVIKKWFQYDKDRAKRIQNSKDIDVEKKIEYDENDGN